MSICESHVNGFIMSVFSFGFFDYLVLFNTPHNFLVKVEHFYIFFFFFLAMPAACGSFWARD